MSKGKVILAYSGGLDTSVAIQWLKENYGYDVVAVALDVGEGKDLDFVKEKALKVGAVKSLVVDTREWFAEHYLLPALKANAMYEGKYPLVSALSRPLIAEVLVRVAAVEGAVAVAHGCTGKGNDQVRFEVAVKALNPELEVIAPVREWAMSRDEEIAYAQNHGIPIPVDLDNPYSIDQNLWGEAVNAVSWRTLGRPRRRGAYEWTAAVEQTPDQPEDVEIAFQRGKPVSLNGNELPFHRLVSELNQLAGKHGVGRIDHVENRLVGIKSREVYECPAAITLITAHRELEFLTQTREVARFKPVVEGKWAELAYEGLWFSPLMKALGAFVEETQATVSGTVRIRLFKGQAVVTGRKSKHSLYSEELATYTPEDTFNHQAAVGFIQLWGLPTEVNSKVNPKKEDPTFDETLGRAIYQADQPTR